MRCRSIRQGCIIISLVPHDLHLKRWQAGRVGRADHLFLLREQLIYLFGLGSAQDQDCDQLVSIIEWNNFFFDSTVRTECAPPTATPPPPSRPFVSRACVAAAPPPCHTALATRRRRPPLKRWPTLSAPPAHRLYCRAAGRRRYSHSPCSKHRQW